VGSVRRPISFGSIALIRDIRGSTNITLKINTSKMILPILAVLLALLLLYLYHVNRGMGSTPPEAVAQSPHRWTESEIRSTFERISKSPIDIRPHLPPVQQQRRYVVVGGSGLVGGAIVLQLLARGQKSDTVRILDFLPPVRADLLHGDAAKVECVQCDITSKESVRNAFAQPWALREMQKWPITVFHTAAVIIPGDRVRVLQSRVSSVNTVGTAHVLAAAHEAGADVFIATSSGSIAIRPCDYWIPPWRRLPNNFVQLYPDPGKDRNLRARNEYCGNYAISKAQAEDLVCKANDGDKFRTGCIRPACGVYGNRYDMTLGSYASAGQNGALPRLV
jgi:nucleoside-diphosphate-sugar epimerase